MLCALVAAGCQSNPAPPPLESTAESSTPSPTASPAEAAPTLPAEAKGTSEAAAKAFVRHYIELTNHAMATGDVQTLEQASNQNCKSCSAVITNISDLYASGGRLEGNGWKVIAIESLQSNPSRTVIQTGVFVSPQKRYPSPSSDPQSFEGGKQSMTFHLERTSRSWSVVRWSQAS